MIPIEIGIALMIVFCSYAFLYIKITLIHGEVMKDKVKGMARDMDKLKDLYCTRMNISKDSIVPKLTVKDIIETLKQKI